MNTLLKKLSSSFSFNTLKHIVRWTVLTAPVAIAIGSMVALFLWLLNWSIHFRFSHPWLLYILPLAGLVIWFVYKKWGGASDKGNNLIMEEIHTPGGGIPKRLTPLVLAATVVTHLFGGSAGREGTAVQIGGSIAQFFSKQFNLNATDTRIMLTAGIAAGFGAVFGTPLAGAIFALEVLAVGRIQYDALLACLVAAIIGDLTVSAWGIHHTAYHIDIIPATQNALSSYFHLDILLLLKVVAAAVVFGITSRLFAQAVHAVKNTMNKFISAQWFVPVIGGVLIIALTLIIGKPDYLSLGVDAEYPGAVTIPSAFHLNGADTWSWLWKTIYTAITLGSGFKGGEVTPLFYIGATLGNTLSQLMDAPVSLFAALGFIAVFAGATNTPLACTIMGVELFGGEYVLLFSIACFTAYFFSGKTGIYGAQRIAVPKVHSNT